MFSLRYIIGTTYHNAERKRDIVRFSGADINRQSITHMVSIYTTFEKLIGICCVRLYQVDSPRFNRILFCPV